MKAPITKARGPLVHLGVLAVAAIAAIGVWTRDKEPKAVAQGDVTVWSGRASDVERVAYEAKTRKVTLEAKKDKVGRYFVGTVEKESTPPPHAAGDAGADATPPPAPTRTTTALVSVSAGDKFAEAVAPFKALRALGKIGDDRAAEFGLDKADASVTIKVGGAERKLLLGGATPGGGDRYIKDAASGEVYAVKGEPFRNLESAESLLMERDLHEWKDIDATEAKIIAGGKTRAIVRGGAEGKKFWADPARPNENDETLGNWTSKLDRLRPTEFVLEAPKGETVVRLEYTGGSKSLGFVEVIKAPGASGKADYFLQTERTRLFGKVAAQLAEQLEQDTGSVVK